MFQRHQTTNNQVIASKLPFKRLISRSRVYVSDFALSIPTKKDGNNCYIDFRIVWEKEESGDFWGAFEAGY